MWLWRGLGGFAFALGAIGLVLPVMPTTIFWIGAAICFAKSDPVVRDWIYARPGIGPQVQLFIEEGKLTRRGKTSALCGMALAVALATWLFWANWWPLGGTLALVLMGALYVISRPNEA